MKIQTSTDHCFVQRWCSDHCFIQRWCTQLLLLPVISVNAVCSQIDTFQFSLRFVCPFCWVQRFDVTLRSKVTICCVLFKNETNEITPLYCSLLWRQDVKLSLAHFTTVQQCFRLDSLLKSVVLFCPYWCWWLFPCFLRIWGGGGKLWRFVLHLCFFFFYTWRSVYTHQLHFFLKAKSSP